MILRKVSDFALNDPGLKCEKYSFHSRSSACVLGYTHSRVSQRRMSACGCLRLRVAETVVQMCACEKKTCQKCMSLGLRSVGITLSKRNICITLRPSSYREDKLE